MAVNNNDIDYTLVRNKANEIDMDIAGEFQNFHVFSLRQWVMSIKRPASFRRRPKSGKSISGANNGTVRLYLSYATERHTDWVSMEIWVQTTGLRMSLTAHTLRSQTTYSI